MWLFIKSERWQVVGLSPHATSAGVHWGKLDAEKLLTDAPPPGKEYRTPEMYYNGVLKGSRRIADECSKDVIFE